ncbi:MAG: acyl-CoA thioesterase [Candidatus Melainabacteria bacterium]
MTAAPTPAPPTRTLSHSLTLDVQIFDTDCFGVMWHGAYIKWLEMGRVKLLEERGMKLSKPGDAEGYIYPVVEQNLRYKSPGWYQDTLTMTTTLRVEGYKLIFDQVFTSHTHQKTTLEATTTVVVLDMNWQLQRRLPPVLQAALA